MGKNLHGKNLSNYFENLEIIKMEKKIKEDNKLVKAGFRTISKDEDAEFLEGPPVPSGGLGATCIIDACGKGIFWVVVSSFFNSINFNYFFYTKGKQD